jgi:hypothetical protein
MNIDVTDWVDFGWQGVRLRVPAQWSLGKIEGNYKNGYARLDDASTVRLEVEWRESPPARRRRLPIEDLVTKYLSSLEKKAEKTGLEFTVERQARFLKDKRWLEGDEYETFTWEADYRAYNLARVCKQCGRIMLLRVLGKAGESNIAEVAEEIFRSLQDHPTDGSVFWCVYGLEFSVPKEFSLSENQLKSGNIQLTFESKDHVCRVQRLSMANQLLKGTDLTSWYSNFFKKQLRDLIYDTHEISESGHEALAVEGRPRSRWRQFLRPLPFLNPRPRQYLDGRVWHCEATNKICVVDHLYKKKDERDELCAVLSQGYVCHQEKAQADSRSDAELATSTE